MTAERFLDEIMILGEGPVWDEKEQALYWVDISAGQLWRHDAVSGQTRRQDLREQIGMCALTEDGRVLAALEKSLVILDGNGGRQVLKDQIEMDKPHNRFNDGKCDARGRLLAGTMSTKGEKAAGKLYSLDMAAGGDLKTLIEDVGISNGIGFSPDDRYMYYVDTPSGALWRFDYDLDTGSISNRRALIDYTQEEGNFDGLTVDAEGHIWVAHWGGFQISRWDPKTRRKLQTISLPAPFVTSCCFGGKDLSTLFITTAWNKDEKVRAEHPEAGGLFMFETDTKGMPGYRFKA